MSPRGPEIPPLWGGEPFPGSTLNQPAGGGGFLVASSPVAEASAPARETLAALSLVQAASCVRFSHFVTSLYVPPILPFCSRAPDPFCGRGRGMGVQCRGGHWCGSSGVWGRGDLCCRQRQSSQIFLLWCLPQPPLSPWSRFKVSGVCFQTL